MSRVCPCQGGVRAVAQGATMATRAGTSECIGVDDLVALGDTVCVWAHPDDETYLCGGTMAALREAGRRVVCITATRGEAGGQTPQDDLAALRTRELDAALGVLGVAEHHWLDVPDGGCAHADARGPVVAIETVLRDVRPATVLTFAPDGLTGHPDHCTVSEWTSQAVARCGLVDVRLLQAAVTAEQRQEFGALEHRLGVYVGRPAEPTHPAELGLDAHLTGALLDRKIEALACQASQTGPLRAQMGEGPFRAWVATETFRRVLIPRAGQ